MTLLSPLVQANQALETTRDQAALSRRSDTLRQDAQSAEEARSFSALLARQRQARAEAAAPRLTESSGTPRSARPGNAEPSVSEGPADHLPGLAQAPAEPAAGPLPLPAEDTHPAADGDTLRSTMLFLAQTQRAGAPRPGTAAVADRHGATSTHDALAETAENTLADQANLPPAPALTEASQLAAGTRLGVSIRTTGALRMPPGALKSATPAASAATSAATSAAQAGKAGTARPDNLGTDGKPATAQPAAAFLAEWAAQSTGADGNGAAEPLSARTDSGFSVPEGSPAAPQAAALPASPLLSHIATANAAGPQPLLPGGMLSPSLDSPAWQAALNQQFIRLGQFAAGQQSTVQQMDLSLNPAALGPLRIMMTVQDGIAHAWINSAHAHVRQSIESALPQLQEAMAHAGLTLADTQVGDHSGDDQTQAFFQAALRSTHSSRAAAHLAADSDAALPAQNPAAARILRPHALLDTFA
ncbi:flagellar hook-length control protein FliK [Kerstersia similis]|uniref:flagellar hook-length control protein FliK n=1 Tax=Kerstersia similis TaxID=206505 RepID=UPI0039EFBF13